MKDAAAPRRPPPIRKSQKTYESALDSDQSSGQASENEFDVRKARS